MRVDQHTVAWWLSKQGRLVGCHGSHTGTALESPESLGFSIEQVERWFAQGEEDAVISQIVAHGWVRLRLQSNRELYAMVPRLDDTYSRLLSLFARALLQTGRVSGDLPVNLEDLRSGIGATPLRKSLGAVATPGGVWSSALHDISPDFADWVVSSARRSHLSGFVKPVPAVSAARAGFGPFPGLALGGVWISPDGVIRSTPSTHIRDVVSNPGVFGLSMEWVSAVFHRFNEGLGKEGGARDYIVGTLVANGWIRIRWHPSDTTYHVELQKLTSKNKNSLFEWASQVLARFPQKAAAWVVVSEVLAGQSVSESTFALSDILDSARFVSSGMPAFSGYRVGR